MQTQHPLRHLRLQKSIVMVGASIIFLTTVVGMVLYVRARQIMQDKLKQNLLSDVTIAAALFDPDDLDAIRTRDDIQKPTYRKLVTRLEFIRDSDPNIYFAYIMRRTKDPASLEFVADADTFQTLEQLDANQNGQVDSDEEPSYPGDLYPVSTDILLAGEAFARPVVDENITTDQWGELISGFAPIRNADGQTVAILGIDMQAREYLGQSQSIFTPELALLSILFSFLIGGYVIFSLWKTEMRGLRQMDREHTEFLHLASHQLGAPLSMFKWWIELFRKEKNIPPEKSEELFLHLDEGVSRMESILDALHEAQEVHERQVNYRPRELDITDAIAAVRREALQRLEKERKQLAIAVEPKLPFAYADAKLVEGVLRELVDNALSYSSENTTVTVFARMRGGMIEVEVKDEGMGIPVDDREHLFRQFMRGKNAVSLKPVGNGLGLYITKGVVEAAGGTIRIESTEGKGTSVFFTMPIVR